MGWTTLLDNNNNEIGIVGDPGWDLASSFMDNLHILYLKQFGRLANYDEIMQTIRFVSNESLNNSIKIEQLKQYKDKNVIVLTCAECGANTMINHEVNCSKIQLPANLLNSNNIFAEIYKDE